MDYLKLAIAKKILEEVAAKNGLLTWYNIVKSIDRLDNIERTPPKSKIIGGDSCAKKQINFLTYPELSAFSMCRGNFCPHTL
nr:hypothetical protein [Prochloraceae cyanobacterium]